MGQGSIQAVGGATDKTVSHESDFDALLGYVLTCVNIHQCLPWSPSITAISLATCLNWRFSNK